MTGEAEVVRAWFDAFAAPDMHKARRLLASDARVHLLQGNESETLAGLDELLMWFDRRRAFHESFSYAVGWMREHDGFVITGLTLSARVDGTVINWPQIAIYRVARGVIAECWFIEDAPESARTSISS